MAEDLWKVSKANWSAQIIHKHWPLKRKMSWLNNCSTTMFSHECVVSGWLSMEKVAPKNEVVIQKSTCVNIYGEVQGISPVTDTVDNHYAAMVPPTHWQNHEYHILWRKKKRSIFPNKFTSRDSFTTKA